MTNAIRHEGIQINRMSTPGNLEECQLLGGRLRIQDDVERGPNRKCSKEFDRPHRHHQENPTGEERRVRPQITEQPSKFALMFQARKSVHRLVAESLEIIQKLSLCKNARADPNPRLKWSPVEIVPCHGASAKHHQT